MTAAAVHDPRDFGQGLAIVAGQQGVDAATIARRSGLDARTVRNVLDGQPPCPRAAEMIARAVGARPDAIYRAAGD